MNEEIIDATRHWLTQAVIGLNLCPFAKAVYVKEQIRYAVSEARTFEDVLADLESELKHLADSDPEETDTTLLIVPYTLGDFAEYNDALHFADTLLKQLKLEGELQIASFHPDYQFDDASPDDIENFTNRAPYPIFHLLREASIERAVDAFPDAADIYERNMSTLRRLGQAGWQEQMKRDIDLKP
ncbi:DUF1415 domain-containing protein [Caballeronia sp. dw_276]|jgi:hypothetical protein|uniref:DUF1415 domain-containing protein n=1 Tax=Caballeronia sp. dw_276 TaxID=2719795 RepID=UPI001BD6630C|nr:DUF1415 domain-containing protein [Caballeronia sp. dw_276]